MKYELTNPQRINLLALLERTNLQGKEVQAYNELYNIFIKEELNDSQEIPEIPKEEVPKEETK